MTTSLSVQLYSVRDAVTENLQAAVDRLAAIGFTDVEPYGFAERPAEFAAALKSAGLAAPSGHAAVIASDDPDAIFAAAVEVGIETVIDPHAPDPSWASTDAVVALAERVNSLSATAAAHGLRFGYHNHNLELEKTFDGQTALELFASQLAPEVVLEVDTYWAEVGGVDAAALLTRLGDRVQLIHVKDGPRVGGKELQAPAGQGEMPIAAILAAAPQARRVIEFDVYAGDVFEGIAESFAWLTEHDTVGAEK